MKQEVVLVDELDNELGSMEKLEAHQKGLLHRAVSVFIFDGNFKLLLQRRAMQKYHSPGLWTNTACTHPAPGETALQAATRRLKEEMGLECGLEHAFNFTYRVEFANGLIEHELDQVFIGYLNKRPTPDSNEVMDWQWLSEPETKLLLKINPELFTEWFKICCGGVFKYVKTKNKLTLAP